MKRDLFIPKNLVKTINTYYKDVIEKRQDRRKREWDCILAYKGIDIFLKFLPPKFKQSFLQQIPAEISSKRYKSLQWDKKTARKNNVEQLIRLYTARLLKKKGLKLFIGKDAYYLYESYKKISPADDSMFLPYSRLSLFHTANGNRYFQLVDLIYESYQNSSSLKDFHKQYKSRLRSKEKLYLTIKLKTLKLLSASRYHTLKEQKKVIIVDSGTQGGLIFPLQTVLEDEGIACDFSIFSCFNWICDFFGKHTFTSDLFSFILVEHAGTKLYYQRTKD